jgi:hypothetical protein
MSACAPAPASIRSKEPASSKRQAANLIVATGHNNLAMNRSVEQVAKHFVDGNRLQEGLLNRVQAVVRAYDPCLSCSTHAAGQIPLRVQLFAADGTLLDETRDPVDRRGVTWRGLSVGCGETPILISWNLRRTLWRTLQRAASALQPTQVSAWAPKRQPGKIRRLRHQMGLPPYSTCPTNAP